MFRLESYITPILWSYFSKYVKNFNSHDFQVSLWNGGAVFSNLELNLDVLDSELQIPLSFASGHIQELKITVPWRKITSEPIILNVNSMELVLRHKEMGDLSQNKSSDLVMQQKNDQPNGDKNSGYMRNLIMKIVSNVRVNFENVVIKYIESDISFSVNVGEASMGPADENWKTVFLDQILYTPEFVLRKKLSFSDVNICLDRCNNVGLVDKFQDPMLYRCDFDVRIVQKFVSSYSRVPYFYRMDLFLGHLQFCVTDEQIPMLVRLYNLFSWLMESGTMETEVNGNKSKSPDDVESASSASESEVAADADTKCQEGNHVDEATTESNGSSWTSWATGWLYNLPDVVFGEDEEYPGEDAVDTGNDNVTEETDSTQNGFRLPTPPPMPSSPIPENIPEDLPLPPPTTHFGVYINTLTIIFKAVKRVCDKPVLQRRIISKNPFLKCSIQGVVCDFIARGNTNSHTLGVSSIMVDGLGYCPCGVQDSNSSEILVPAQGGQCYFEAGKINQSFSTLSFFQTPEECSDEWNYDVDHKDYLTFAEETKMLDKTPAFVLRYIVTRKEAGIFDHINNSQQLQNPEISEIMYHGVGAPCKILVCSGLIHRLKMIYGAINNYDYEPYGFQPPDSGYRFDVDSGEKQPATTYRIVIRQPLIEVFAADHPIDYTPVKRAQYFRRNGGIIPPIVLSQLTPEWPKMVISWDILECTAEDTDGNFLRFRGRVLNPAQQNDKTKNVDLIVKDEHNILRNDDQKTASVKFYIAEVLLTFIAEPMELNLGIKKAGVQFTFASLCSDYEPKIDGSIGLDSITCSSRLEKRSNVLCLPFSATMVSKLYWQSNTLSTPSANCEVDITALNVYIGPETVITVSQLVHKLNIYVEEFLPKSVNTNAKEIRNNNLYRPYRSQFSDTLLSKSLPDNAAICKNSKSLVWQYPQKRTLTSLIVSTFKCQELSLTLPELSFDVEYFEEFTNSFYHFRSFELSDGGTTFLQFRGFLESNVISSRIWRIRMMNGNTRQANPVFESLIKCLVVESIHIPEVNFKVNASEILLNLVNNTFYSGKNVNLPTLQPYGVAERKCPADHIVAALHMSESHIYYSAIEGMSRCNMDFSVDVKVLDYESVKLEPIMDPVGVGVELFIPTDAIESYSLNCATDNINVKLGASVVHSVMYSFALWNQIISSFDIQNFKMDINENMPKVILNRILVGNDLLSDIRIRSSDLQPFCYNIPSKDCKAISFPGINTTTEDENHLFISVGTSNEVKIDIYKSGYSSHQLNEESCIFANISSISTSQKLVKISGPLIVANGLDRSVEFSIALYSQTTTTKIIIPSCGTCPTVLSPLSSVEHFRFRFIYSEGQQPWSEGVFSNSLLENPSENTSFTNLKMLSHVNGMISETNIWVTLITEKIQGVERHLIVLSPSYCVRSWLASETLIHLSSADNRNHDIYPIAGKGSELEMRVSPENGGAYFIKFQSNTKVPPSGKAVPIAGPIASLNASRKVKSIDEILAELTETGKRVNSVEQNFTWPFIEDNIPLNEWNTEINPETEILVSYSPWICGLPTTVAEIRPWALFINLSGVEILFAQETTSKEWDQYWVPYKCAFSPKRIEIPAGKFRVGLMMNDFLVKSQPLQFSDQPERRNVKKINKDYKVPIDCYSRLDLFGGSQIACLTIETRVRNKVLVFVIRPTYSIQNRTSTEVFATGVTISSAIPQRRESWTNDKLAMYSCLEPIFTDKASEANGAAVPILHFHTDGQNYSAATPSYKYLALSCGGPWWFTQLVDYSEEKAEQNTSKGIPGAVQAVNLPKVDVTILSALNRHKLRSVKISSESVVIGSYTKNGQVWVSINEDNAPQFTIHNKSDVAIFYAEKDQNEKIPRLSTPCFQQYMMVPPDTSCHFNLCNAYNSFPQLNKREAVVPDMLLAEVSQDLVDFVTSHQAQSLVSLDSRLNYSNKKQEKCPSGNLLFPDFDIDWQRVLNVSNNPTQYAKFGNQSVKISVEIVGYTYHIFIENTKVKEVSAKDIRHGFSTPRMGDITTKELMTMPSIAAFQSTKSKKRQSIASIGSFSSKDTNEPSVSSSGFKLSEREYDQPSSPPQELSVITYTRPWKVKLHISELYIAVQDDINGNGKTEREFLGITFEPIMIEQVPLIEDSRLRPVECRRREAWIYTVRVGNMQVDTPNVKRQRPCEFLVVMEPVKKNERICSTNDKTAFAIPKYLSTIPQPSVLNVDATVTFTRISADEVSLETVWLRVLPFSFYVEDRLLSYVIPSVHNIQNVFNEAYITIESTYESAAELTGRKSYPTAVESGVTAHITITDSVDSSYGAFEHESLFHGVAIQRKSPGPGMLQPNSIFSRCISFDPAPLSSSSGLNSSNSSIVSSLSHLRLASVSPPPPSPMMHLEPHGYSSSKIPTKSIIEVTPNNPSSESQEDDAKDVFAVQSVKVPTEVLKLFNQLMRPVRLKKIDIQATELELTLRTEKVLYVSLDRSVVQLRPFIAYSSISTDFHLGLELTVHYTMGTIFTIGNPVRVLGSLELLGSPGTLARTVGTGLRDLVVYPYEGILNGPVGFVSGLGFGVSSLLRSVTSGTLVSLTNWAESVSRNIDRLTSDEQEQLISEAARQVELQGFADGIVQGLSGFGIRMLGAIGGLSHHPMNSVIQQGPSATGMIGGVSRGVIGMVVKPIGGVAELISMTGQGVLLATGWKPRPKAKKTRNKK